MKKYLIVSAILVALSSCQSGKAIQENLGVRGNELISSYVAEFNATDEEIYVQDFPNSAAEQFMKDNVPVFECPDKELEKTYYFRWWTFRKHVKTTPEGYIITEFLPDVSWAGKYNAICCPAMHQFAEGRWMRDYKYLLDYAEYWCREKKDARRYSFPIADSYLKFYAVYQDMDFIRKSYPHLKEIYAAWIDHWDEEPGLYWQTDNRDGMEVSISGLLGKDIKGYRATINSYMYADAAALATMAEMLGETEEADYYKAEAAKMKDIVNNRLWDEAARFYKVIPRGGDMTMSYAREQHGYVPWMYDIPEKDRSDAWYQLTDPQGFKAPYGPTTAEQRAEGFKVIYEGHPCQWNGPSWPFATAQTLTALARTIHRFGETEGATKSAYFETLQTYSKSHRRVNENGQTVCWIDENIHPYTGDWICRTMHLGINYKYRERGKDYNHSSFCDLVINGLMGLQPQLDGTVVIEPLLPEGEWDWFSISRICCGGREISVVYDKTGEHYGGPKGFTVYVDGKKAAHADTYATRLVI